jgi:hypothetical protein
MTSPLAKNDTGNQQKPAENGNVKSGYAETMTSPLAKTVTGSQQKPAENGNVKSGSETGSHKEANCNGIIKSPVPATAEVSSGATAVTSGNKDLSSMVGLPNGNGEIKPNTDRQK